MAKLELYRKFTNALAVSILLSIAWIGFEVKFISVLLTKLTPFDLLELMKFGWYIIC